MSSLLLPPRRAIGRRLAKLSRNTLLKPFTPDKISQAIAGRIAGLEDMAAFASCHPHELTVPLVLISQAQRSGGTLLNQLFDGHPQLSVHPHELKIGFPAPERWPSLDPANAAETNFRRLFEFKSAQYVRDGYTQGQRDPVRHRFMFAPKIQHRVFLALCERHPPHTSRDILNHYFSSYFTAWLNYQGTFEQKRWIVSFVPRLANHEASVTGFFGSYPDGRLIQILRDPWTWCASARISPRWQKTDAPAEKLADVWLASALAMQRNRAAHPQSVVLIAFDDLLRKTAAVMQTLADMLGIEFDHILTQPTFNGRSMLANSSFAVAERGIITEPLSRKSSLPDDEKQMIDRKCGAIYETLRSEVLRF